MRQLVGYELVEMERRGYYSNLVWLILSRVKEYSVNCLAMTYLQIFKKFPACESCTTTEDFVLRLLGKSQRSD